MASVVKYIKESMTELTDHVSWTSMSELQKFTTIVLIALFVMTILILVMDKISEFTMIDGIYSNI